jgi:protein-L-isoaspartate O-methyltransferase
LLEQLAPHAKLVLPLGTDDQRLVRVCDGATERLLEVRFVPLVNG